MAIAIDNKRNQEVDSGLFGVTSLGRARKILSGKKTIIMRMGIYHKVAASSVVETCKGKRDDHRSKETTEAATYWTQFRGGGRSSAMTTTNNKVWVLLVVELVWCLHIPWLVAAYNRPDCATWPGPDAWQSLANSFTNGSILYALNDNNDTQEGGQQQQQDFQEQCIVQGTNAFAIAASGNGMCMQNFQCQYQFCNLDNQRSDALPEYSVDVRSEVDIATVLHFANKHNIPVSIKTSGHSYMGSSTAADSILLWMANYPKDGTITQGFLDSCGTNHSTVIGIGGGSTWNDVIESVQDKYHVVTGSARTVSAAGGYVVVAVVGVFVLLGRVLRSLSHPVPGFCVGPYHDHTPPLPFLDIFFRWLQGGGLSWTVRKYGMGVDNVVSIRVVLANGTVVTTDACTHPDLFWALRGGGGGTFGVVTHTHYLLHPVTNIVVCNWFLQGIDYMLEQQLYQPLIAFSKQWLEYWVSVAPTLHNGWGGFWNQVGGYLVFSGTLEEAKVTFLDQWDYWYNNTLDKSQMQVGLWGAVLPSLQVTTYASWYEFKGGADAYNNPNATDPTGTVYDIAVMAARLAPKQFVENNSEAVVDLLHTLGVANQLSPINYLLGGVMNDVAPNATSVHPAARNSVFNVMTFSDEGAQQVRDLWPNSITGVCYNHHSGAEPDWRNACWGENLHRLETIKAEYDPSHRFNCWHCVGYQGTEWPDTASSSSSSSSGSTTNSSSLEEACPSTNTSTNLNNTVTSSGALVRLTAIGWLFTFVPWVVVVA